MKRLISALLRDESGEDLIEYGLLASLIVIVVIATLGDAGAEVNALWTPIVEGLAALP